jgi:hypothetical protein
MALRLAELELRETAPCFLGIVVRDGRFEPLAQRCRLCELAAEPAEQSDGVRTRRGHRGILTTRLSCVDFAPIV